MAESWRQTANGQHDGGPPVQILNRSLSARAG
jgi:hypothetical protein